MRFKIIPCLFVLFQLFHFRYSQAQSHLPKTIFAHYMGCYPLDKYNNELSSVDPHDQTNYKSAIGGRIVNWPLLPAGMKLSEIDAAALDIKRAIRAGIDGFSVDVLAGKEIGLHTLDVLFAAAEKYDLPFQITFCLDAHYRNPGAIKYLLEKHGKSPKLARRDGKVLLFGYYSQRDAEHYAQEYFDRKKTGKQTVPEAYYKDTRFAGFPQLERDTLSFPELKSMDDFVNDARAFAAHVKTFRHYEQRFGTPLYMQFELSSVLRAAAPRFRGAEGFRQVKEIVNILSRGFNSLGLFLPTTFLSDEQIVELAQITRQNNCEWEEALNYQYDNELWERIHVGRTGEQIQHRWDMIEKTGATLLQFTTWNDYAENTQLAPSKEIGYTYADLNAWFVKRWKEGREPKTDDDKIYVIYPKYQREAEKTCFPFQIARHLDYDKPIEVITILKSPGTVSMPGRNVSWQAPEGYSYHQVAGTPGTVQVLLQRGGVTTKELKCPEPIASRIFREQVTPTTFTTEFNKQWKADFGSVPPETDGWYGDKDNDGLPNWFEMVWFGRYGDFSTCTGAKPGDDPDHDGFTNLQEYKNGTDPTRADNIPYEKNFTWDLIKDSTPGLSFNPERDSHQKNVWHYLASWGNRMFDFQLTAYFAGRKNIVSHKGFPYSLWQHPYGSDERDPFQPTSSIDMIWENNSHDIELNTTGRNGAAIAWNSPVDGKIRIELACKSDNSNGDLEVTGPGANNRLALKHLKKDENLDEVFSEVTVHKGDRITVHAIRTSEPGKVKITKLRITNQ